MIIDAGQKLEINGLVVQSRNSNTQWGNQFVTSFKVEAVSKTNKMELTDDNIKWKSVGTYTTHCSSMSDD